MSYYKVKDNDLFVNTIEAYPDVSFYVQSGSIYIDNQNYISGTHSDNILGVPRGFVSLYELNINRSSSAEIYPFLTKGAERIGFKSQTKEEWNTQFNYSGQTITSSYNMSASIRRYFVTGSAGVTRNDGTWPKSNVINVNRLNDDPAVDFYRTNESYLRALKNTINHYKYLSPKFDFDKYYTEKVNLISIPSIFYGSTIRKGSVNLKYYISGTLAAQASDTGYRGELIQVSGTTTGDIVGTVLYDQGFILLTSSAEIDSTTINYEAAAASSWLYFGYGSNDGNFDSARSDNTIQSASFAIEFQGTNHVQTMTIMAKAPYGQLNHSNNPTYLKNSLKGLQMSTSGTYEYREQPRVIKNIVPVDYTDVEPPMQKETYISKIALYDDGMNVIGFAKMATPVRKTEDREFIFKLKLDL
jgi:hypothetical protein